MTRNKDAALTKVKIWVSPELTPYIKTKPLHDSQIIKSEDSTGMIVEIYIYPNFEMEQLFLSHGEGIRVMSPDSIREKIEARLASALKNYKKFI